MNRHNNYSYSFAPGTTPRYASASHAGSSAQSASANPDEDWTKISDLAERRRIQNRIAQRNYRKKLKRRLEDLERRAGSSSASPEHSHAEIVPVHPNRPRDDEGKRRRVKLENSASSHGRSPNLHSIPSASPRDDAAGMFSRQYTRQRSISPPPSFTYSYPAPDPPIHAPYPQPAPFISLPAPYSDYQSQPLYLPPLPVTLPSMSSYDSMTSKAGGNAYSEDDFASQFNMTYSGSMNGIEVPTSSPSYADSNSYTPPLSISHSFDHSRTGSPSDPAMMPGTPTSMPGSPQYMLG